MQKAVCYYIYFSFKFRGIKVNYKQYITLLNNSLKQNKSKIKTAKYCSINAKNISMLENNKIEIGKKRALQLAAAFDVHPAIIMFPEYESKEIQKVA